MTKPRSKKAGSSRGANKRQSSAAKPKCQPAKRELGRVSDLLPVLESKQRKGDIGRMVVIGGSKDMGLAPGFAAFAQIKAGADQSTLFLHPTGNADLLRSKFMAVLVRPTHNFEQMFPTLEKSHGIVIGPGMVGDEKAELPLLKRLLGFAKSHLSTNLIIDANAIDMLAKCTVAELPKTPNIAATPNHKEFELLCRSFAIGAGSDEERLKRLANKLGMCVVLKGATDLITDGTQLVKGETRGSPRRTAGLGDVYAGLCSIFAHYSSSQSSAHQPVVTKRDLVSGCHAASDLLRYACRLAFTADGRSMTVEEVLKCLVRAVKDAEKGGGTAARRGGTYGR